MDDPTRWQVHGTRRVYASPWVNLDLDDVEKVGLPDTAESSRIEWIKLTTVPTLLRDGAIPDGPTVTALSYYLATR